MIITPLNLLALPVLIVTWALDIYLWMTCLRLVLGRFIGVQGTALYAGLCELTDPVRNTVDRCLGMMWNRSFAGWLLWLTGILVMLITRHLLLFTITSMNG
jgi:hypothetical protein